MNFFPSWKIAGALAAISFALGGAGSWRITSWQYQALESKAVKAAAGAERKSLQHVIDELRGQITAATEASNVYQAELARLRNADVLAPVVRVCNGAERAARSLPTARTAARGPDAAREAGGVGTGAATADSARGRDIGPGVSELADELDRCSAQLRGLQEWIKRTAASQP